MSAWTTAEQIADEILETVETIGHTKVTPEVRSFARLSIEVAMVAAFIVGFEHAVHGGKEAAKKLPSLKSSLPVVLYFKDEADRQKLIDAYHQIKPGVVEVKIPEPHE